MKEGESRAGLGCCKCQEVLGEMVREWAQVTESSGVMRGVLEMGTVGHWSIQIFNRTRIVTWLLLMLTLSCALSGIKFLIQSYCTGCRN